MVERGFNLHARPAPGPPEHCPRSNQVFSASSVRDVAPICERIVSAPRRPSARRSASSAASCISTSGNSANPTIRTASRLLKQADDVSEILGVVARHNSHAVLRRFDDIVSAARHQASAHERHIRQGVEGGEFPNRVDQQHAPCEWFPRPLRAPDAAGSPIAAAESQLLEAFGMPWAPESSPPRGWLTRTILESPQQRRLLVFHCTAANQDRPGPLCRH